MGYVRFLGARVAVSRKNGSSTTVNTTPALRLSGSLGELRPTLHPRNLVTLYFWLNFNLIEVCRGVGCGWIVVNIFGRG